MVVLLEAALVGAVVVGLWLAVLYGVWLVLRLVDRLRGRP